MWLKCDFFFYSCVPLACILYLIDCFVVGSGIVHIVLYFLLDCFVTIMDCSSMSVVAVYILIYLPNLCIANLPSCLLLFAYYILSSPPFYTSLFRYEERQFK